MKRLFGLIFAAILAFAFTACGRTAETAGTVANQSDSPKTSKSQSNGKQVLFVESRDNAGDNIVVKRLKETHGLEVKIIIDKELANEKVDGYALVYVSESVNSGKIKDKFVKLPVPVIYAEPQSTGDVGMTVTEGFGKLDAGNVAKTVQIKNSKHPLAAGLENLVDVYKDNGKMGYATPGQEAIVIATVPNDEQKATVFAYEKGAKNAKGDPVAAREVFFYLMNGEEINQTENGWKLFDAAVRWAMGQK